MIVGSMWIDLDLVSGGLKYVSNTTYVKTVVGVNHGVKAGALIGSIWVEGSNLCYIGTDNSVKFVIEPGVDHGYGGIPGSIWLDPDTELRWTDQNGIVRST